MISGNTKVYSVIGNPVKHSKSPNMHNAAFQALNINARYVPLEPRNEDLKNICNLIKFGIISGSNVTIPFKEAVMEYVDVLTDEASMIGSVNTLYSRDGKLVGNNTDGLGFKKSLFSDLNEPLLEVVKKSFLQCCRDYFKLKNVKEDSRLWFYQDWKSNPHRDGQYWHDHPVTFYGLSGIMYLTLPDDSSTTGFSVNADKHSLGSYFEVQNMIYLPRETKKWFIFPNWYPHFPGRCETENRRITVGADYWVI